MDERSPHTENSSVLYMLGQLTAKVDALLTNQNTFNKRHEELDGRVTALERDRAKLIGGTLAISAIVGLGIDFFIR